MDSEKWPDFPRGLLDLARKLAAYDPNNGENLLRRTVDNGDGTVTLSRKIHLQIERGTFGTVRFVGEPNADGLYEIKMPVDIMAETRKMLR